MTESEIKNFNEKLTEKEFKESFEAHKNFRQDLDEGLDYKAKIEKLETIHEELYGKKKSIFINPKFYIPFSIAATITLLIALFPPGGESQSGDSNNDYVELYNADDGADEASEEAFYEEEVTNVTYPLEPIDSLLQLNSKQPIGTAFQLTENGIFVTSKHLVEGKEFVKLQNKELNLTFEVKVVYVDTLMDIAFLICHENIAQNLEKVPFKFSDKTTELGEEIFTLGYPKKDIVYTKGDVSSENGFKSDSLYLEISMPSSPGYSGSPLFDQEGYLVGIITANNSKKQSVTYSLKHHYIQELISDLDKMDILEIDMSSNYIKKKYKRPQFIKLYRGFVFEVH